MGEFHHNIDEKGRIIIPSKLRDDLGSKIIVTRWLDSCLFLYSEEQWKVIVSKLQTLPFTKKDARAFLRFFLSGAQECTFDKQGRIAIPMPLVNHANLKKECVVIGVNDRLEIWSESKFNEYFNQNDDNISDIAEDLFDNMEV